MIRLSNKKILLCITGGIAAYKTPELTRIFKKNGADVRIIMTESSKEFVAPLSLQAVSGNQIHYSLIDEEAELGMGHIELAKWADVILIAPCTAESISRLSQGRANDLMSAVILASDADLFIAPAMNVKMWGDKVTQKNVKTLKIKNVNFIGPDSGDQACGDVGEGRMSEPEDIAFAIAKSFSSSYLNGMRILITAGPTKEAIDPVRYLTNNSSGKMGYALAESAFLAGAQVDLVSGPVSINAYEGVNLHKINSADEMLEKIKTLINGIDIFIGCAAVADFKPTNYIDSKIKKTDENNMSINLTKNPDILKYASENMKDKIVIGFSAETDNIIENARLKLSKKELDMIICNDVSDPSIGFDSDNNEVHIITKDYEKKLHKTSKIRIAKEILKNIEPLIN